MILIHGFKNIFQRIETTQLIKDFKIVKMIINFPAKQLLMYDN